MATFEERLTCVEHEVACIERDNAELKKSVELLNIALGGLVNKATLEKVSEQSNKIFETLMRHDQFTNHQLAELRGQLTEQDGKIVGLQTEMRQEFLNFRGQLAEQDGKIVGLQTEMRQKFAEQDGKIAGLQTEMRQGFAEQDGKIAGLQTEMRQEFLNFRGQLAEQDGKIAGLQAEMRQGFAEIRQEVAQMRQGFAEVKQDVSSIYAQLSGLEKLLIDRLPPAQ